MKSDFINKKLMRILSITLVLVMVFLSAPINPVFAAETVEAPVFSKSGGFYQQAFSLTLSAKAGSQIRYTTDGSTPTKDSKLYTGVITVDAPPLSESPMSNGSGVSGALPKAVMNARVIKAAAFSADGTVSSTPVTNTYFINPNFSIPVLALSMEPKDFVGETGMYTKYENKDLTPQTFIEYYTPEGTRGFKRSAQIKIAGHGSRRDRKKSLRINFAKGNKGEDERGGTLLEYDLIPSATQNFKSTTKVEKHAKITARTTDWQDTTIHETMIATIGEPLRPETMNVEPMAVFVNGEFWGVYETREEVDNNYVEQHYPGIKKKQVVALAFDWDTGNNKYAEGTPLRKASYDEGPDDGEAVWFQAYMEMHSAITKNDLSIPENYENVKNYVDIDNLIDYYLLYMMGANTDWPGNNYKLWRTVDKNDDIYGNDGKWRFIIHDFDTMSFGSASQDSMVSYTTASSDTDYTRPTWATSIYKSLFKSEEFRTKLAARQSTYTGTAFAPATTIAQLDALVAARENDIGKEFLRWGSNGGTTSLTTWKNRINSLRNFLNVRPTNVIGHIRNYYNNNYALGAPADYANITFSVNPEYGYFDVSGAEIRPDLYKREVVAGWTAPYIKKLPISIKANKIPGHNFVRFEVTKNGQTENINTSSFVLTPGQSDSTITVKAVFENAAIGNKAALQSLYDANKSKTQGTNSDDSWTKFNVQLEAARVLLLPGDITEDVLQEAVDNLSATILALKPVDTSKLVSLINGVNNLRQGGYTSETWLGFKTSLKEAKELIARGTTSQAKVNSTFDMLQIAINALAEPRINLALNAQVTASNELNGNTAKKAVDGDIKSRWESVHMATTGTAWFQVDLGRRYKINDIAISWEVASTRAKNFTIEFSKDGENWSQAFDVENYDGYFLNDWAGVYQGNQPEAQYIRLKGTEKSGTFGYSICEFEVYGSPRVDGYTDKAALTEIVKANENVTRGNYSIQSWTAFKDARDTAVELLADANATQTAVDNAHDTLEDAAAALVTLPLNKTVLQALYNENKERAKGNYTNTSWTDFENARDNAIAILARTNVTQEVVDAALDALKDAIDKLILIDKTALRSLYEEKTAIMKGNYTQSSWSTFEQARKTAAEVLANEDALQEAIDAARIALSTAFDDLIAVNKAALQVLYDTHKNTQQGNCSNASWADFEKARIAASQVLTDPDALQNVVDSAFDGLTEAIKELKEIPVDKSVLQPIYNANKDKQKGNYTDKSWTNFRNALASAKKVLDNKEATQIEVNREIIVLNAAINGLQNIKYAKTKKVTVLKYGVATNLTNKKIYIVSGKKGKLTIKGMVLPANAMQGVTYESKNSKIATISNKGVITGKKAGTVKITIISKDKSISKTITIKVVKKAEAIKSLKVTSKKNLILKLKKTSQIKTRILPASTTYKLTYVPKNKKIVTVSKTGEITAKKIGKTKITVKCGKKMVVIEVTVKK